MHEDQSTENTVIGYNPQLLLTDERGTHRYMALAAVIAYREAFPDIRSFWSNFGDGGLIGAIHGKTPRERDPEMIAILPAGEKIVPRHYVIGTGRMTFPDHIRPQKLPVFKMDFESFDLQELKDAADALAKRARNYQQEMYARFLMEGDLVFPRQLGKTDFFGLDLAHLERRYYTEPEAVDLEEPTKQNGRSAAYLKHDKSKSHKRRKRK